MDSGKLPIGAKPPKRCGKCKLTKPRSEFSPSKKSGDKLHAYCKSCRTRIHREIDRRPESIARRHAKYASGVRWRANEIRRAIRKRAKREGVAFDLDTDWIAERFARGICELTGIAFDMALVGKVGARTPSVDRVIPGGAYTKDNCRVILYALNLAMRDFGIDEVIPIAKALATRFTNKENYR